MDIIKSISYNQDEIIKNILNLHIKKDTFDCDPTYSKGIFYKDIPKPTYRYDLVSTSDDVIEADCRSLPLASNSISSLMFDPPFLATKGPSLKKKNKSNKINKRFGVYPTETELHQMYDSSFCEFKRILKPKGILVFKCQDKVSSGKQYFSHIYIYDMAIKYNFYPLDLFILLSHNRLIADWQKKNQKHARKYHSYFWVFRKNK